MPQFTLSTLLYIILAACVALAAAAPMLQPQAGSGEGAEESGSGSGFEATTMEDPVSTTTLPPPTYDCSAAASQPDFLEEAAGSLKTGLEIINSYSSVVRESWMSRDESLSCPDSIRVLKHIAIPRQISVRNLANTVAILEAYRDIASIAAEQESDTTIQEQLIIIEDLLSGVISDYDKVLTPAFCDCEAGATSSCFTIPNIYSSLPPECNASGYILSQLNYETKNGIREFSRWISPRQQNISPSVVSDEDWVMSHFDSDSPANNIQL